MQTILSLVASEMGVSILPKSAAESGIKDVAVRPLAGKWPQSELGVATLSSSADEPRLRKFLTIAVQLQQGSARSQGPRSSPPVTTLKIPGGSNS